MTDGRLLRGERTRRAVLDAAVDTASVDGLEGMTLSRLAGTLGVSKSGLFAHWPDKQSLQLAIIEHAQQQWIEHIVEPALRQPRGIRRLWALHELRLKFYADSVLPGGCFFAAAGGEFDDRPGPVRDAIATCIVEWLALLIRVARQAVDVGELRADVRPEQLAFEIQAMGEGVVHSSRLLNVAKAGAFARHGVLDRLRSLATDPSLLPKA